MKTPITNRHKSMIYGTVPASIASRLESDRAALMEALEGLVSLVNYGYLDRGIGTETKDGVKKLNAREALSAARANFPD